MNNKHIFLRLKNSKVLFFAILAALLLVVGFIATVSILSEREQENKKYFIEEFKKPEIVFSDDSIRHKGIDINYMIGGIASIGQLPELLTLDEEKIDVLIEDLDIDCRWDIERICNTSYSLNPDNFRSRINFKIFVNDDDEIKGYWFETSYAVDVKKMVELLGKPNKVIVGNGLYAIDDGVWYEYSDLGLTFKAEKEDRDYLNFDSEDPITEVVWGADVSSSFKDIYEVQRLDIINSSEILK